MPPVAIRKAAEEIRRRHNVDRYPVPIGMIAEKEGAVIKYAPMISDGSLTRTTQGYLIKINQISHPYRQRFTMAHELGHMVLGRVMEKSASGRNCTPGRFTDEREEERWCDCFAAYLLIPDSAVAMFNDWKEISIEKLIQIAHQVEVSVGALVWRALEEAPYEGGALWFRMMAKPTDPTDIKLRLDWGVFPKSTRMYLPRYDAVPKTSPIHQAMAHPSENVYEDVNLNFGSLRGKRTLMVKAISQRVLAIVLPEEVNPGQFVSQRSIPLVSCTSREVNLFGEDQTDDNIV